MKFGGYSIAIAQIDEKIEENLKFYYQVIRSDMTDMRCFSIGGMKNQHDTTLESLGTTDEIIISLIRSPSTTYFLLSSFLSYSQNFECPSSLFSSHSSKLFVSQILT